MRHIKTISLLVLVLVFIRNYASGEDGFVEIIESNVNIYGSPDLSSAVVAEAEKGDIFELCEEDRGWYEIKMFSVRGRYIPESSAEMCEHMVSLPSASTCRAIRDALPELETRAQEEADFKYPVYHVAGNPHGDPYKEYQNREYTLLLVDRYKLALFRRLSVQPAAYNKILEKTERQKIRGE